MEREKIIEKLYSQCDNIFISSDNIQCKTVQTLINKYNLTLYNENSTDTILFGSTCKYVILSSGSFSFMIGMFSFFSEVYYNDKAGSGWHPEFYTQLSYKKNTIHIDDL